MNRSLYGVILALVFAPTLVQLLDQLLHLMGIYSTPGALLGKLSGAGWLGRKLLAGLTVLGFPPHASGSAVGPFHVGGGALVLALNAVAVALAGRRLFLNPPWGGNVPAPTFENPQAVVAWIALGFLLLALLQKMAGLAIAPLDRFILQISFGKVGGADHLGAILLAFSFWWTEIRNLGRAVAQAG